MRVAILALLLLIIAGCWYCQWIWVWVGLGLLVALLLAWALFNEHIKLPEGWTERRREWWRNNWSKMMKSVLTALIVIASIVALVCLVNHFLGTIGSPCTNMPPCSATPAPKTTGSMNYQPVNPGDTRLAMVSDTTFTRLASTDGRGRLIPPLGRRMTFGPARLGGFKVHYQTAQGDTATVDYPAEAQHRELPYPLAWVEFLPMLNDTITVVVRIHQ